MKWPLIAMMWVLGTIWATCYIASAFPDHWMDLWYGFPFVCSCFFTAAAGFTVCVHMDLKRLPK